MKTERCTETLENGIVYSKDNREALEKLSKLEDIEEELGIDFILISNVTKHGFWEKYNEKRFHFYNQIKIIYYNMWDCPLVIKGSDGIYDTTVYLNEYGKNWALTKEELK